MQRIVECESDLLSHHRKKANLFDRIDIRSFTAKSERSDFAVGCRQRESAQTVDSVLLQNLLEFGKPSVVGFERSHQRRLILIDPPGIGFLDGQFRVWRDSCFCLRVDEMPVKGIRFLVTNGHTDIIKPDDPVQLPHQRSKQILWISMRSDSIRYADERFVSCSG